MMISYPFIALVVFIIPWVLLSEYEANKRACDASQ